MRAPNWTYGGPIYGRAVVAVVPQPHVALSSNKAPNNAVTHVSGHVDRINMSAALARKIRGGEAGQPANGSTNIYHAST